MWPERAALTPARPPEASPTLRRRPAGPCTNLTRSSRRATHDRPQPAAASPNAGNDGPQTPSDAVPPARFPLNRIQQRSSVRHARTSNSANDYPSMHVQVLSGGRAHATRDLRLLLRHMMNRNSYLHLTSYTAGSILRCPTASHDD